MFHQSAVAQCADPSPTGDCDGDGVLNQADLDDDNDGILDTDEGECGVFEFRLNGNPVTQIAGTGSTAQVASGDIYRVSNGLLNTTTSTSYDIYYSIINRTPTGSVIISGGNLIEITDNIGGRDVWVEYEIVFSEAGSSTPTNPLGNLITINDFIMILGDVDSEGPRDITEIAGVPSSVPTSDVVFGSNLEPGGFENTPPAPPTGYNFYRVRTDIFTPNTTWVGEVNTTTFAPGP